MQNFLDVVEKKNGSKKKEQICDSSHLDGDGWTGA